MASEAERKSKGAVKVRKRNERKRSDAPKRTEETARVGRGDWEGLWGGALQGCETEDAECAIRVAMGRLQPAKAPGT